MRTVLKRVVVNKHHIKHNLKHPWDQKPVFSVQCRGRVYYGDQVLLRGSTKLRYNKERPLKCGASVWLETKEDVIIESYDKPDVLL